MRTRLRAYEAEPAYAFVAARGAALSPIGGESAGPLTDAIVAMLESAAPDLNRRDAQRVTATLRYFASPLFWARMRTGFEMSADEAFEVFDRAVDRILPVAIKAKRTT